MPDFTILNFTRIFNSGNQFFVHFNKLEVFFNTISPNIPFKKFKYTMKNKMSFLKR